MYDERLYKYVTDRSEVVTESGCWLWLKALAKDGYGKAHWKGESKQPHRLAWIAKYGPIPAGMSACHRCDVRACVNPDHLFIGTCKMNSEDMVAKGRGARGEAVNLSKLTEADVVAIREATGSYAAIGREFGVSWSAIRYIKIGRTWRHVA